MERRDPLLARIDSEIEAGRLWRAKEIARGAMPASVRNPARLERFGQVFDRLGDRLEAGRCFFLSGARRPEYEEPIRLFLMRHRGRDLVGQLPGAVRGLAFTELPAAVREELRARGVPAERFGPPPPAQASRQWVTWAVTAVLLILGAAFFIGAYNGLMTLVRWLGRLMS